VARAHRLPCFRSSVIRSGPAGGGYSTVADLLRFDQALRSGKVLKQASLDQLWSAHPEVSSTEYGLGFGVDRSPAGRIVGHSGGFDGISANLKMFLDAGYTLAVLANYGGATEPVESKARQLIAQGH
jgi:CubicO group peptidase (beta-lactamase class C family)